MGKQFAASWEFAPSADGNNVALESRYVSQSGHGLEISNTQLGELESLYEPKGAERPAELCWLSWRQQMSEYSSASELRRIYHAVWIIMR